MVECYGSFLPSHSGGTAPMIRKSFLADFSVIKSRSLSAGRQTGLVLRGDKGALFICNVHVTPQYPMKYDAGSAHTDVREWYRDDGWGFQLPTAW
eukprot:2595032-Pyramimonas_sp.AAC.1